MSKPNLSVGTKAWADKINEAWRQSAAGFVDIGRILLRAKEAVPHGEFEKMVKQDLDFTPQTARKLMAVANDQRVLNRAQGRALPDHWTTLYELTKLDDDELEKAFETGVIHSEMRRADVPKKRKESPQGDAVQAADGSRAMSAHPLTADARTPQTDAKSEDSAVTYQDEPIASAWQESRSEFDDAPDDGLRPGYRGAPDGSVVLCVGPDAMNRFANGLLLAFAVSRELTPRDAAEQWPADIAPLSAQELREFTNWMLAFEDEVANAALQSAVAE